VVHCNDREPAHAGDEGSAPQWIYGGQPLAVGQELPASKELLARRVVACVHLAELQFLPLEAPGEALHQGGRHSVLVLSLRSGCQATGIRRGGGDNQSSGYECCIDSIYAAGQACLLAHWVVLCGVHGSGWIDR
jgi:hypothetical protein